MTQMKNARLARLKGVFSVGKAAEKTDFIK